MALATPAFSQETPRGLSIHPTSLVGPVTARSQAVTLTNATDKTVRYQADVYRWEQVDGRHVHTPTTEALAAPPLVEIPPHSTRVVRVMRTQGQGAAYFRLLLRELPPPSAGNDGSQVHMPLNHNLALAFEPSSNASPKVSAQPQANGYVISNTGGTAARLTSIGPDGSAAWRTGALGWVLPGSSLLVELASSQRASSLTLTVNGKPVTVPAGP